MEIIVYGFLLLIIVVSLVFYRIKLPTIKGAIGESRIARQLRKLKDDQYKILNDVLIISGDRSSQIDHIVVSVYGIYVIETKNYSGWIFGNENSEYWTQSIYKTKTKFRNPIKQNWGHVSALKKALSDFKQIKYKPIVVFVGSGVLKNIISDTPVIYGHQLFRTIISKSETPILTIGQVDIIVDKLLKINIHDNSIRKEHVHQIRDNIYKRKRMVKSLVCPKCGGGLVVRDGKYGKFYGCSNYPKCKHKVSLG